MLDVNPKKSEKTIYHVKKAFEMFATGLYTQQDIRNYLEKEGFKTNKNFVGRMLKNQIYFVYQKV